MDGEGHPDQDPRDIRDTIGDGADDWGWGTHIKGIGRKISPATISNFVIPGDEMIDPSDCPCVMAGLGPATHDSAADIGKVVGGRPSPAMTRKGTPTVNLFVTWYYSATQAFANSLAVIPLATGPA